MATYTKIRGKWRAQVRKTGHKDISKSFATKAAAIVWATDIEKKMAAGEAPRQANAGTVADLIEQYRKLRAATRPIVRKSTEHYTLVTLERTLGSIQRTALTAEGLLGWARMRADEGVQPYTVKCELSKLTTVLRYCAPELLPQIDASVPKLSYLGLIGASKPRERRPSAEELQLILQWLEQHAGRPMRDCVLFASLTAMRRSECVGLLWSDLDEHQRMVLVRNRKDPRQKVGNDQWVPLLYGSFEIVLNQERASERIFPIHPKAVTKAFTECRKALGLEDIVLHDMRHEGISRMFEAGFGIPQVAVVSGHKSWSHLKRYTNLKPQSLHSHVAHQGSRPHPESQQSAASRPDTSSP